MGKIVEVKSKESFEETLTNEKIVLVDFYANWCGPCMMLMPILEKISEEVDGVTIIKLNVETSDNKVLAANLSVRGIPSVFLYKNGEQVDKFVGLKQKEEILSIIEKHR